MTFRNFIYTAAILMLAACQSQPYKGPTGNVKIGKPYIVDGKTYYPEYDEHYDRTGEASWYGPGFHGKYTANGETYDQDDLTAAHPTLPMPSLVRVTNLGNGKSAIIRVNDRGPFKSSRIIDLSKKSAQRLGINGLAKVRVQFLRQETEEYLAAIRGGQQFDMIAYNDQPREAKIVESTRHSSYDNQNVAAAAPVMTVNSVETIKVIEPPPPADEQPAPIEAQDVPPAEGAPSLMRQAWADDNISMPEPEQAAPAAGIPAPQEQAAPEPAEKPVEMVAITPPKVVMDSDAASGSYTIQAGSFASEENAYKLVGKLSDIDKAVVHKIESGDKSWWRVRVGSYGDRASAESVLEQVRASGVADARIVRR